MEQDNNVLNELKEQLSALQAKLDRQTEINDKAIRMAIDKSADKMHSLGMSSVLICIIGLILVETIVILQGVSIPFAIATAVFMGGNAITAIFFKYRLMDIDPGQSMVETASQMVKYKKFNRRSVVMGLPIAIAWAGWYCFEMIRILGIASPKQIISLVAALLIGGIIGGFAGYLEIYRPSMREAYNIIRQINELEA